MDERERALAEAAEAHAADSERLNRPRILIEGTQEDITENVVSLIDALAFAVSHGSGYLSTEEDDAVERLKNRLQFQCEMEYFDPPRPRFFAARKKTRRPCTLVYGHDGPHSYERPVAETPGDSD